MKLKLGVRINIHNRHFLYEYLPAGRIEQEDGNELLQEDGDFLMWEGYSLDPLLVQEDGFNILQETGDYLIFEGAVPVRIELHQETGFNILAEGTNLDGKVLLVDGY